jgi:thiol-disulfide isomerase/thioredoxin
LIVLGFSSWILYNRLSLGHLKAAAPTDPLLARLQANLPAILYFTTPTCIPCRTVQKPALIELQAELGAGIQVLEIDSLEQPEVADRWGVFSAPTTFILDREHKPQKVNRGVASAETLKKQLQAIA